MESIERITSEIEQIELETNQVIQSIQKIEGLTATDLEVFGSRKDILKEYIKDKGIRLPFFLARVKDETLFHYKREKELSDLRSQKKELAIRKERADWLLSLVNLKGDNKENVLRRYLSKDQIDDIMFAYKLIQETSNKSIQTILIRSIKDVLSICRYIEIFDGNIEYEVTDQLYARIDALRTLMYHTCDYKEHKSNLGYIKGADSMPKMYRSIEGYDFLLYKEIMRLLRKIKNGSDEPEEIMTRNQIKYYETSSRNFKIIYGIKNGVIVIYDIKDASQKSIVNPRVVYSMESFFKKPVDNETQSAYDALISNQLDLTKNNRSISKRLENIRNAQKGR